MRQQVAEAALADPARADVLMTIRPRAPLRARIVEVDHGQPPQPQLAVELREPGIDLVGIVHPDPRPPGVGNVETEDSRASGTPSAAASSAIRACSSMVVPMDAPPPAAFSSTRIGSRRGRGVGTRSVRRRTALLPR